MARTVQRLSPGTILQCSMPEAVSPNNTVNSLLASCSHPSAQHLSRDWSEHRLICGFEDNRIPFGPEDGYQPPRRFPFRLIVEGDVNDT